VCECVCVSVCVNVCVNVCVCVSVCAVRSTCQCQMKSTQLKQVLLSSPYGTQEVTTASLLEVDIMNPRNFRL